MKKVRALCSIMHEGEWRIPGMPSEVFDVTEDRYERLKNNVIEIEVATPKPPKKPAAAKEPAAAKKPAAARKPVPTAPKSRKRPTK